MIDISKKAVEFWFKFIESDTIERNEMLKNLLRNYIKECYKIYKGNEELGVHCLVSIIRSYLDDFEKAIKIYDELYV